MKLGRNVKMFDVVQGRCHRGSVPTTAAVDSCHAKRAAQRMPAVELLKILYMWLGHVG